MGNDATAKLVWTGTRIDSGRARRLAEVARDQDRSVSALIRRLIDRELEAHEREAA